MNRARRNFLLAGAGAAVVAGAYLTRRSLLPRAEASARQPLWIPPLLDAREQRQSLSLNAQGGSKEFFPGKRSATLGYNGSYLGPTLRVHRGDDVQVAVANALREDTTVHWHGLLIPGDRDGGPHQTIAPGATWRTLLPVRQAGATLFYHSHVHGRTAEQVYAGLAGVLLVHDPLEDHLGLPAQYGVDDLPLVIQDRQFDDGRLVMPGGMMTMMHGRLGDTLLVNGTPNAEVRVPARMVRLRLVNGSNARIYEVSFDDRRPFQWIASEGGLLAAPVALRSLTLAPGERAEILVDFSDGRPASLLPGVVNNGMRMGPMGRMGGMGAMGPGAASDQVLLSFIPSGSAPGISPLPSRLAHWRGPDAGRAARRRSFSLDMSMAGMMGGMGSSGRSGTDDHGAFAINGRPFDMHRVDERVSLGDTEIWEVSGQMMAHPFHVHGVQFEVLSRGGRAPTVRDQGLRDTVLVQEPVELLVRFDQPSTAAPFMYHCHILEHEDNGMMGQFTVT